MAIQKQTRSVNQSWIGSFRTFFLPLAVGECFISTHENGVLKFLHLCFWKDLFLWTEGKKKTFWKISVYLWMVQSHTRQNHTYMQKECLFCFLLTVATLQLFVLKFSWCWLYWVFLFFVLLLFRTIAVLYAKNSPEYMFSWNEARAEQHTDVFLFFFFALVYNVK